MKLLTASGQRSVEANAMKLGIGTAEMMERAGIAAADYILDRYTPIGEIVPVLCGTGGNGGDGFVLAKRMAEAGAQPLCVLCTGTPSSGQAAAKYKEAVLSGVPVVDLLFEFERIIESVALCRVIVDSVYGIGFHGDLPTELVRLFEEVNHSKAAVVSLDLPSGVQADSGFVSPGSVRANLTLCFVGRKPAHIICGSAMQCGETVLLDIGLPQQAYERAETRIQTLDRETVFPLLSEKSPLAHKGTMGRLLIAAGSEHYRGAALLCARGALTAGAGITELASVEPVLAACAVTMPEVVLSNPFQRPEEFSDSLSRADAACIGCGLTTSLEASALLERMVREIKGTLVIDADGLNLLKGRIEFLKERAGDTVITPHIGELARLRGVEIRAVMENRLKYAREFAREFGCVTVLKSDTTMVALPNGSIYLNTCGNSGLAKGGSGDLLCGIIGAFCAMGKNAAEAALLGVWLHSRAADLAAVRINRYCITASSVARFLSPAMDELTKSPAP